MSAAAKIVFSHKPKTLQQNQASFDGQKYKNSCLEHEMWQLLSPIDLDEFYSPPMTCSSPHIPWQKQGQDKYENKNIFAFS